MELQTLVGLRGELVNVLHRRACGPMWPADQCAWCNHRADEAFGTLTAAGWLDRLTEVERGDEAIVWGGLRWVPADARPDLDAEVELAAVLTVIAWELHGNDGHEINDDGSISLNDAEMAVCSGIAQRALESLALLRVYTLVDPTSVLVVDAANR